MRAWTCVRMRAGLVLRVNDMTTPAALAGTLLQASCELLSASLTHDVGQTMLQLFQKPSVEVDFGGGPRKVDMAFPQLLLHSPTLAATLDAFARAATERSKCGQHAVIVVDEVSILTQWKPDDAVALAGLLDFFVYVARQERTAHVLLVTSESACLDWIQQGEHTCCLLPHTHDAVGRSAHASPNPARTPRAQANTHAQACLLCPGCCTHCTMSACMHSLNPQEKLGLWERHCICCGPAGIGSKDVEILTLGELTKEEVKPYLTFANPGLDAEDEATLERVYEVGCPDLVIWLLAGMQPVASCNLGVMHQHKSAVQP